MIIHRGIFMIDNIPRLLSGIYNLWDVVFHENASNKSDNKNN